MADVRRNFNLRDNIQWGSRNLVNTATGHLIAGFLLLGVPLCIPKASTAAPYARIGGNIAAIWMFGCSMYLFQKIEHHYKLDWEFIDESASDIKGEIISLQQQEILDGYYPQYTSDTPNTPNTPQYTPQLPPRQRLDNAFQNSDQKLREYLKLEGFDFQPEDSLEGLDGPPSKASSDFGSGGGGGGGSENKLADPGGGGGGGGSTGGSESELKINGKWNYPAVIEAVRVRVLAGESLPSAIANTTGAKDGGTFNRVKSLYQEKYGQGN